jgi:CDP-diacylglycerol pyrophosphatase
VAASTSSRWLRAAASLLTVLALLAGTPCAVADPNALWDIVYGQCVPAQLTAHRPAPCAHADLAGGYAVLKDLVGATQFLLIPTARVAGIESPEVLAWNAPNYFADAWRARAYVEHRAGRGLPRDWLSLAVNSAAARSQSQLHIHVDCVRADVRQALATHARAIGPTWSTFPVPLAGQQYRAIAVPGDGLDGVNPFRLLADGLTGGDVMGAQTLVAVGSAGLDGAPGFVLLAGRADAADPGSGHGEDLQDHDTCPPPGEAIDKIGLRVARSPSRTG